MAINTTIGMSAVFNCCGSNDQNNNDNKEIIAVPKK